jgi:hypothetical protein
MIAEEFELVDESALTKMVNKWSKEEAVVAWTSVTPPFDERLRHLPFTKKRNSARRIHFPDTDVHARVKYYKMNSHSKILFYENFFYCGSCIISPTNKAHGIRRMRGENPGVEELDSTSCSCCNESKSPLLVRHKSVS